MKKNYLFSLILVLISQLNWSQCDPLVINGISINIVGSCNALSGFYNFTGTVEGKNSYTSIKGIGGEKVSISYNGTMWILHESDDITSFGFQNTTVSSELIPPLTGWVSTNCTDGGVAGALEILEGVNLCSGATVEDMWYYALTDNEDDLNFYTSGDATATALDGDFLLTSGNYYVSRVVGSCESDKSAFHLNITNSPDNSVTNNSGVLVANENDLKASYQWYLAKGESDKAIGGAINKSFTPTSNGDYNVIVTLGICSVKSQRINISTLGNTNFESQSDISLYPNPTKSKVHIKSNLGGNLQIVNQLGQIVKTLKVTAKIESTIYVGDLSKGLYFVKINNTTSQKLIVK